MDLGCGVREWEIFGREELFVVVGVFVKFYVELLGNCINSGWFVCLCVVS